jgi:anti-sigma B factor antagonist
VRRPGIDSRRRPAAGPARGHPGTTPGTPSMSPQPRRRRLEVEDIGDVTVVNFVDKKILDEQNIQVIGEQLFQLVDELGRRKILLNFKNVEFLSSAALGKLITLNRKLQSAGGKLVLCEIDPQIYEVFEITKLNKLFTIVKDEQTGLQSF